MKSDDITYSIRKKITVGQFVDLLNRSTLGLRRPVNDKARIGKMLAHGNILVTAWSGNKLVGVSRALSDFAFCCYLSDLAVDEAYQRKGIGKELVHRTKKAAGEGAMLILLAAPAAVDYYPRIGLERFNHCYILR